MWDNPPTGFAKSFEKVAVKHVKKIGRDVISSLADVSPIDTTQYVSNHNVNVDSPDWSHNENKLLGDRGSEPQGLATIESMSSTELHDLWFTNATPYGGELEEGKSAQAPNGVYHPVFLAVTQWYKD